VKLDRGILAGLGADTLFGLSTPIAKMLVGEISPLPLAGLLYSGSGVNSRRNTMNKQLAARVLGQRGD
jgi:hypothetical protein